jgi:hypothetical protein
MLRLTFADMLFTGDGEAFNVSSMLDNYVETEVDLGIGRTIP